MCSAYGVLRATMYSSNDSKMYTSTRQVLGLAQLKFNNWVRKCEWREFSFNALSTKLIQINKLNNCNCTPLCPILHFSANAKYLPSYLIDFFLLESFQYVHVVDYYDSYGSDAMVLRWIRETDVFKKPTIPLPNTWIRWYSYRYREIGKI